MPPFRVELVGELVARAAGALAERIAALDHERVDDPVEDRAVIVRPGALPAGAGVGPLLRAFRQPREVLDRLAMQTNATAQLCALRGNKYVVVDTRDGSGVFRITTDIGVEVPIPWTASGRLLLDHMSAAEILDFIPEEDFQLPDGRVVDAKSFVADIARARTEGSCMTNGLSDRFTCCLAAAIRDRRGIAVATLCFIVPIDSAAERKRELLDRLVESARELSDQ